MVRIFLISYFRTLKDKSILYLLSLINKIESSYEESYNRNKNLLSFIQILINNYDGSNEMKKNIIRNKIYIYHFEEKLNQNELITYYNRYCIVAKKVYEH